MKTLITLLIATALVLIGTIVFALSGVYNVSASSPHGGVINWLLTTTSHASIERYSSDIDVPDLSDSSLARAGVKDFDAMCTACHGAPGQEPEAVGQGLNPPAPDLAESAAHMDPAELFWVTKNGIRMTGMPAWGATHDDDAIWPVVAFMTTLGDLDADGYQALLASSEGMGHHAGGGDQDSHGHGDAEPTSAEDVGHHAGGDDQGSHGHGDAEPASDAEGHGHGEKEEPPEDDGHDHEH